MKIMLHGLNEMTFHVTQGVGSSHDGPAWDPGHHGPSGLVSSCIWNSPPPHRREVLPAAVPPAWLCFLPAGISLQLIGQRRVDSEDGVRIPALGSGWPLTSPV